MPIAPSPIGVLVDRGLLLRAGMPGSTTVYYGLPSELAGSTNQTIDPGGVRVDLSTLRVNS